LVIRRAGTGAVPIDADENGTADGNVDTDGNGATDATYASLGAGFNLQVSNCSDIPAESAFVMDHDTSKFTVHKVKPAGAPASCLNGGLSPLRRFHVHLYYVSTCNNCTGAGDGIPTLKVVELTPATTPCSSAVTASCGSMSPPRAIAEGIENLQFEYGVDSDDNGTPDTFTSGAVAAADWKKVVAVKAFLLARNVEPTPGYVDGKKYSLNSAGDELTDASGTAITPFNDSFKRHVYTSTVMATNIAGRKLP
jgi:type IV pilus assembly protein PilW